VHVVEPTGSETQVLAYLGETLVLCAFRERVLARPGETIHVLPDTGVVHLFDAGTGQRYDS
jgi:multiple sugar transport system ATP-binding protein